MSKLKINFIMAIALVFTGAVQSFGQNVPSNADAQVDKLIAVLKSDALYKEKADACRQLAVIGTKEAIAPLIALLSDEKLSHMARYGLESIPDLAVDEALRNALGKFKGRPLVGVIGSIGVRRDARAVGQLSKMLQNGDSEVVQASARALGKIGNLAAARALQGALKNTSDTSRLALCEGLFRCAETLAAGGQRDEAIAIYDQLLSTRAPHQVRAGALRGAILTREKERLALIKQYLRSDDYILFSTAAQIAQELPGPEVTRALADELKKMPANNQVLVIQTLGKRGDAAALPALLSMVKSSEKSVRFAAIRALPEIGNPSAVPILIELMDNPDGNIAKIAKESLAALPGREADEAVMAMLSSSEASRKLTAIELIGRRRMKTAISALLKAASDTNPKVRQAALKKVGELGSPTELPAMFDLLIHLKKEKDMYAAEQALRAICTRADNPESYAEKHIDMLTRAQPAQKITLLRILSAIGGKKALMAVRAAINDSNTDIHAAAIRALGAWKTVDAAPELLKLAKTAGNPNDRTLCLRNYLGLAARPDLLVSQRLLMCRQAAGLVQRNDEKKLLLSALSIIITTNAIGLIMPYLDSPATSAEASMAVIKIAEKLLKGRTASKFAPRLIEPLEKVVQVNANAGLTQRAKKLLQRAQSRKRRK